MRSLLLLPALLLVAPSFVGELASSTGIESLSEVGTAQAKFIKKFKGKTKFDRKMNETITDDATTNGTGGFTVVTTAAFPELGLEVPPATLDTGHAARIIHRANVEPGAGPVVVSLDYDGVPMDFVFELPDPWEPGVVQVQRGELGVRVRLRTTGDDGVRIAVRNQDSLWNPEALSPVLVSDGLGEVELDEGILRLTHMSDFDLSVLPPLADLEGAVYTASISLLDADGTLVEQRLDLDAVGEDGIDTGFEKVKVTETRRGDLRVVAYSRGVAAELQVDARDEGGLPLISDSSSEPAGVERWFADSTLTFEEPDLAADEVYNLVVDFLAADGSALGSSDYEIVVEGLDTGDVERAPVTALVNGELVPAQVHIRQLDATNFELFVAVESGAVEFVGVSVLAQAGPPTIPEELSLGVHTQWTRWIVKGNAGTGTLGEGGLGSLELSLTDESGALIGYAGGTIRELPELMFSFGKGTKSSASSASAKPELL